MDWLKDKPGLQLLLNAVLLLLIAIFISWNTNRQVKASSVITDIEDLQRLKAPFTYVDKIYDEHVIYDKRQDAKVETMRKEWREDHKEILRLISNIPK